MPFHVSPGVIVTERDLTNIVPAVSTTEGAIAGVFRWGPLNKIVLVDSEASLAQRYGRPTNHNPETWFTAASFLAYGNKLYVSRAANTTANVASTTTTDSPNSVMTAIATTNSALVGNTVELASYIVKNEDDYALKTFESGGGVLYVAKYPGAMGNSLRVSVCDSANQFQSNLSVSNVAFVVGSNTANLVTADANAATDLLALLTIGDILTVGNTTIGTQDVKVSAAEVSGANVILDLEDPFVLSRPFSNVTSIQRRWEYYGAVEKVPGQSTHMSSFGNTSANDELHVVVTDQDGLFTGVPGTILEVYQGLSRATDAKNEDGSSNYYKSVINDGSKYVWWVADRSGAVSNTAGQVVSSTNGLPLTLDFVFGQDGDNETSAPVSVLATAYDRFISSEDVDISLVLTGKAKGGTNGEQLANYLIDNIAEARKDCVVFCSPDRADVVTNVAADESADVVAFRNSLRSTSYGVMDSGYKYTYDKYNDVYRFIPLNGDMAGLCARTDDIRDPWWSPAGLNRGGIKNIIKLAYNPGKADRDVLYKAGVNPVVTFPGQGTILFGDKTLLAKPSAFDRINVRRLFIVLEKAISTAAKFLLFEQNDEFTRAQFRNMVEPFLRDVQGRRGIYDFRVVCDETNNTGEVIDRNEFVGDIYIKPSRSISYITLNFVAVRTGVEFNEIIGQGA